METEQWCVNLKFRWNFDETSNPFFEVPNQTTRFLLKFQVWLFEISNLKVGVSTLCVLYVLQDTVKIHLFFPNDFCDLTPTQEFETSKNN